METLLYKGAENPLHLIKEYSLNFYCQLDLRMFPFDTQKCFLEVNLYLKWYFNTFVISQSFKIKSPLSMESFIQLKFGNVSFSGNPILTQFEVRNVSIGKTIFAIC